MAPNDSVIYRLRFAFALFVLTVLVGTITYGALLHLNPLDALYFTIVTLTTVGYGDIMPSPGVARVFTIFFILGGFSIAYYTLGTLLAAIVEGEVRGAIQRSRAERKSRRMQNHTIICGLGRIGQELADSFATESVPFVVIENSEEGAAAGEKAGYVVLKGDATNDDTLRKAGIDRARCIVSALPSDADNLYIVISARQLNPSIRTVARATDENSAEKMRKAGADRAVRPVHIGARQMAQAVLRPAVMDFIQLSSRSPRQEFAIEEINVAGGSSLAGKKLIEIGALKEFGIIVIGIKRAGGDTVFNPSGDTPVEGGDTLVVIGRLEALTRLAALAGQPAHAY